MAATGVLLKEAERSTTQIQSLLVEAREYVIFTGHLPLTYAFRNPRKNCSPRQYRYFNNILLYTTDIRYIPGAENVVAVMLKACRI